MSEAKGSTALFDRLMHKAGAKSYRVGGRVRVAYTDGTDAKILDAMKEAVRTMSGRVAEGLAEPDAATKAAWFKAGLVMLEVGDEPCPDGVSLADCPAAWLVERCRRYHAALTVKDGKLGMTPDAGKTRDEVLKITPAWFVNAVKNRKADLLDHLGKSPPPAVPAEGATVAPSDPPAGLDVVTCPVRVLVNACRPFGFTLILKDGKLRPLPDEGRAEDEVRAATPDWLRQALIARKDDVVRWLTVPDEVVATTPADMAGLNADDFEFCRKCNGWVNRHLRADVVAMCPLWDCDQGRKCHSNGEG